MDTDKQTSAIDTSIVKLRLSCRSKKYGKRAVDPKRTASSFLTHGVLR